VKRMIFLAIFFACLMGERIDAPVLRETIPLRVVGCPAYEEARRLYLRGYGLQEIRQGEALGLFFEARDLVVNCEGAKILQRRVEERIGTR